MADHRTARQATDREMARAQQLDRLESLRSADYALGLIKEVLRSFHRDMEDLWDRAEEVSEATARDQSDLRVALKEVTDEAQADDREQALSARRADPVVVEREHLRDLYVLITAMQPHTKGATRFETNRLLAHLRLYLGDEG